MREGAREGEKGRVREGERKNEREGEIDRVGQTSRETFNVHTWDIFMPIKMIILRRGNERKRAVYA